DRPAITIARPVPSEAAPVAAIAAAPGSAAGSHRPSASACAAAEAPSASAKARTAAWITRFERGIAVRDEFLSFAHGPAHAPRVVRHMLPAWSGTCSPHGPAHAPAQPFRDPRERWREGCLARAFLLGFAWATIASKGRRRGDSTC